MSDWYQIVPGKSEPCNNSDLCDICGRLTRYPDLPKLADFYNHDVRPLTRDESVVYQLEGRLVEWWAKGPRSLWKTTW